MNRDELLKLENQFCFAVYACAREITKLYRPHLDELGITYTQYVALLALWERDDITVKELGARLYLDSGTLTPLLKKLEALKLLTRIRDPQDERNVRIRLTPQGAALKEKAYDLPEKLFCVTGMTEDETTALRLRLTSLLEQVHLKTTEE
ncbi:MarR family transcriptional regulator [Paenibacillus validus]|uniref:MarR family winged helix-turn-helix transcriptional regulator n=1 Tax=Paenibacillus TaxID=44249 RepID=UPI0006CFA92D|nr:MULTISPECIES: MarR family transcriptional regulator [Paenibacillus]MED4603119.1 MarR family transcriptional regulator [Paenibacillus validus]MED4608097.1 MarR family transcriptional regulator [Paenibacillus validus]